MHNFMCFFFLTRVFSFHVFHFEWPAFISKSFKSTCYISESSLWFQISCVIQLLSFFRRPGTTFDSFCQSGSTLDSSLGKATLSLLSVVLETNNSTKFDPDYIFWRTDETYSLHQIVLIVVPVFKSFGTGIHLLL